MDDLMLKRLKELQAQQTSTLDDQELADPQDPNGLAGLGMTQMEDVQDLDGTIEDPNAPEQVRLDAIKKVREKYLGR